MISPLRQICLFIFLCSAAAQNTLTKPVDLMQMNFVMKQAMTDQQGLLSSYNIVNSSDDIKITWKFALSKNMFFSLRSRRMLFDFYPSCPNCCPENAVYVPNNHQGLNVFCANNVFDTLTTSARNFHIIFVSHLPTQGIRFEYSIRNKTEQCSGNMYKCLNGVGCYNINTICDDIYNCEDHSDEKNCMKCRTGYATCNNTNSTIVHGYNCFNPEKHRCDGILQCPFGEDELNCSKRCQGQLMCKDKHGCYSIQQRCDNVVDCKDHSDEANCNSVPCEILKNKTDYFQCKNDWCIRKDRVNNGKSNCDDNSDESIISKNSEGNSTEARKENSTETHNENSTEIRNENSTEIRNENSTEIRNENSTEIRNENGTEIRNENSTEIRKENSTEIRKENSNKQKAVTVKESNVTNWAMILYIVIPFILAVAVFGGISGWLGWYKQVYYFCKNGGKSTRKSSFIYNYMPNSVQVPPSPKRYLKPKRYLHDVVETNRNSFVDIHVPNPTGHAFQQICIPPLPKRYLKRKHCECHEATNRQLHVSEQDIIPPPPKRYLKPKTCLKPKHYLKPNCCKSDSLHEAINIGTNNTDNSIDNINTVATNLVNSTEEELYSSENIYQEITVNPSVSEELPDVVVDTNTSDFSSQEITNKTANEKKSTKNRLKSGSASLPGLKVDDSSSRGSAVRFKNLLLD